MATLPTRLRASAHHGYQSWTCTWYDDQGHRRTKRFGRVGVVTKQEALALYERWKSDDWKSKPSVRNPGDPKSLTVRQLCESYYEHSRTLYRKNGKQTTHMAQVAAAMNWLIEFHANMPADALGAPEVTRLRDAMIHGGKRKSRPDTLTAGTINARLRIIKQCYAWARSYGTVSRETAYDLSLVKPLKAGRSDAAPSKVVKPVPQKVMDATLAHCPQTVRDMIQIQLLTGARSGEVCQLRPCDVAKQGKDWVYTVPSHKTEHHGKSRLIPFGPRAMRIIAPYVKRRKLTEPVFTPSDAHRERLEMSGFENVMAYQLSRSTFKPGRTYTNETYRNAIQRACDRAFDPKGERRKVKDFSHRWHPHQLRHNYATRIREEFGIEAAADMLGHSHVATTAIYAEQALGKMKEIARKAG